MSWLNRFLRYLRVHGAIGELAFMSFEHYPFDGCEHGVKLLVVEKVGLVRQKREDCNYTAVHDQRKRRTGAHPACKHD